MKMDDRAVCDELHMDHALALARMGWGQVSPNPLVGAVVVAGGEVIGEGFHARYGESHAEVNALREAGDGARGATLYVNLEPCAHEGQTPPCTDAIIRAGIRRTVYGCRDVDPLAAGG
ncbi:MAG: bifunctional diaminohydroxyphosphoribosylaminopyrimidine deaminase/5-amino-6-(5-phosphoribosylamino)uracil reductase RibD, partial [Candidatus Palauibacterales bacterium]|nr:bifunctional diaminohydroxyphosphoribosylaminopyrimidine deaminase/5-amino-6-(5-phosphoribosylamino)uracil reductase RibD [Candidatus Palauibacterales bacterium]